VILYLQKLSLKTRLIGVLVGFFGVFCLFYALRDTPWFLVQLRQYSSEHGLPDELFWYTPAQLHAILGAWGVVGRDFYRTMLLPLDLVFAVAYSVFLAMALLYLLKKINPRSAWWYFLPVLPVVGGVCDEVENLGVLTSSWLYPDKWDWLGTVMGVATAGKWSLLALNLGLVVLLIFWHWGQRLRHLLTPDA
jgi:hypothetical protein